MWVNWFLKGRNKEINEGFAPKNQVLRLKKNRKERSQQTSCKHQVTQIFFPPNMSNLTVAGFVPYQAPWILYLAIHIKRVEIELKTHSTILLQNLFAGSNYPLGRYYLPKINAKQISFPSSLAEGLKIHLFNTKWAWLYHIYHILKKKLNKIEFIELHIKMEEWYQYSYMHKTSGPFHLQILHNFSN